MANKNNLKDLWVPLLVFFVFSGGVVAIRKRRHERKGCEGSSSVVLFSELESLRMPRNGYLSWSTLHGDARSHVGRDSNPRHCAGLRHQRLRAGAIKRTRIALQNAILA